jgi:hypothetical protein
MDRKVLLFVIVLVVSLLFLRLKKNRVESITNSKSQITKCNVQDSKSKFEFQDEIKDEIYEKADFKSAVKQTGDCCSPTTLCKCLPTQLPDRLDKLDISRVWTSTRPGGNLDHRKIASSGANTSAGHPQMVAFNE